MPHTKNISLLELFEHFDEKSECLAYLEDLRWPDGVRCPRCNSEKIARLEKYQRFLCNSCDYQFTVTAGTVFHDSHLPLPKWFIATYLMVQSKKGISANQLKRMLKVSYKTAWYLCHRIRAAMTEESPELLKGTVEVDETWVGGKKKGVGSGSRIGKALAIGAVQREGKIRLKVIRGRNKKTLHKFIHEHTAPTTEAIYTDEWKGYIGIGDHDTEHKTVNHSEEEWVNGEVHTNTVENVWSLLKRSIVGAYHKVSVKHLDAYLDELEWRFNNRKSPWLFRDTLKRLLNCKSMPFQVLVS